MRPNKVLELVCYVSNSRTEISHKRQAEAQRHARQQHYGHVLPSLRGMAQYLHNFFCIIRRPPTESARAPQSDLPKSGELRRVA